ncbi:MAG: hypothetical protein BAJALOKI1v1_910015 [Promethearchaeota archaeon]|nr:MAG: hypothetical protein BAJALOKI1v1_910015 [Candidatus Lokiarchaeota archaeon]
MKASGDNTRGMRYNTHFSVKYESTPFKEGYFKVKLVYKLSLDMILNLSIKFKNPCSNTIFIL